MAPLQTACLIIIIIESSVQVENCCLKFGSDFATKEKLLDLAQFMVANKTHVLFQNHVDAATAAATAARAASATTALAARYWVLHTYFKISNTRLS